MLGPLPRAPDVHPQASATSLRPASSEGAHRALYWAETHRALYWAGAHRALYWAGARHPWLGAGRCAPSWAHLGRQAPRPSGRSPASRTAAPPPCAPCRARRRGRCHAPSLWGVEAPIEGRGGMRVHRSPLASQWVIRPRGSPRGAALRPRPLPGTFLALPGTFQEACLALPASRRPLASVRAAPAQAPRGAASAPARAGEEGEGEEGEGEDIVVSACMQGTSSVAINARHQ